MQGARFAIYARRVRHTTCIDRPESGLGRCFAAYCAWVVRVDVELKSRNLFHESQCFPLHSIFQSNQESYVRYDRSSDVCSRCGFNAYSEEFSSDEEPVCEYLPKGVNALSSGTTVSTFHLQEGYYRVSAESRTILECYNEDACVGGDTAGQYCATGYEGPCTCTRTLAAYLRQ